MQKQISTLCSVLFVVLAMATMASCSGSGNGGDSILVTVTNYPQNRLSGVTVVLGDSNGAMKTYGTTDVNGEITFIDPPADATVTAVKSCLFSGSTATAYDMDVRYDVNGPVTLYLYRCSAPSTSIASPDRGTVTINVINSVNEVTQNRIVINDSPFFLWPEALITQQTFTITSYDIQPDGKLSIVVTGQDATGKSIAYGALLDQTFVDGMTVNITVDQPMSFVEYQITNMPATTENLFLSIFHKRTETAWIYWSDRYSLSSAPSSTTIQVGYIPALGGQFRYGVGAYFDQNQNGYTESSQSIYLSGSTVPSSQIFDFNQALQSPSNLSISGVNTATPTFSWSGLDPGVTDLSVRATLELPSNPYFYFWSRGLSPTRTSITFPELPDSLAAFRPAGVDSFSVDASAYSEEISKYSSAKYSTTFNYSPIFNKPHPDFVLKRRAGRM